MGYYRDEASLQHPKRSKLNDHSQFSSTSMHDSIPTIPQELVTEILIKLPVKSLLRFRCVSKSWVAFISSPEFVKTHLSLSANNNDYAHRKVMMSSCRAKYSFKDCTLRSLFYESVSEAVDLDFPTKPEGLSWTCSYDISIVGSVNGLICLVIEDRDLFLWNPSIRKYKKLPDPRSTLGVLSWRSYGFGYDELHDDYKVVIIFFDFILDSFQNEVKIYSMKSDSWRSVDDCPSRVQLHFSGKFLNGKLHWATSRRYRKRNIMSFDLAEEKWGMMEQPCLGEGDVHVRLGVLGDDLSVSCNCSYTHIDVWVMKEYGVKDSWIKMFTLKYPYQRRVNLGLRCLIRSNDDKILVLGRSTFMIYNSKGDLLKCSKIINFDSWREAEIYVESLVCPFSMDENNMTGDAKNQTEEKLMSSRQFYLSYLT